MTSKSLNWKGDALLKKVREAQIEGVNQTMADCVAHAKSNHPWKNRTGLLEGDIQVAEYAHPDERGVVGVWGVRGESRQGLILEFGGLIKPKNKQALKFQLPDGSWRIVKSVTIRPHPYLRPAADAIYPTMARNILAAFTKDSSQKGGNVDG